MVNFLKAFGRGVLYVVLFPFAILLISCYAVVGFLIFLFLIGKSVILFFKGKTIFSDLPEDIEAKRILSEREAALSVSTPEVTPNVEIEEEPNTDGPLSLYPSDSNMYKTEFQKPEENISPVAEENSIQEEPKIEPVSNTNPIPSHEPKKDEEIIETYKPLSSNNKDKR